MGAGNDALFTSAFVNEIDLGAGNDTLFLQNGAGVDTVDLGDGVNTMLSSDAGDVESITGGKDTENITIGGGAAGMLHLFDAPTL